MTLEVLTNLIPRSVSLEYTGSEPPDLTAEEWSCILLGCSDHEWNLAMLIYCGDAARTRSLADYLLTLPLPLKNKKVSVNSLKRGQQEVIRRLSSLAVEEYAENPICKTCNGQKKLLTITCGACDGTGLKRWTDKDRAIQANIPQGKYKLYEPIYQRFLIKLGAMDTANRMRYREFLEQE
jgi:hypothetical protein